MVAARAHESRARCFRSAWRYPVLQQITENPITSVHSLVPWRRVDGLVRVEVWDVDAKKFGASRFARALARANTRRALSRKI